MTQPEPPINLELDPSGYITGLGKAEEQTKGFIGTLSSLNVATATTAGALTKLAPSRPVLAAFTGFSAAAANAQKQLAPLQATTRTLSKDAESAGKSVGLLSKGANQLAKDLPIGARGAREVVTSMTQLGLAVKGQEKQVLGLARAYTELGGANSESPAALAQSMTQLSRATNSGNSVKRVTDLGDSLTVVAAKSGSSALGVAQFAKSISASAQSSGIGATKILGIASAFTRLGEDGFGAATAFNKVSNDLQRSVREGSPEIAKYAAILGKTSKEVKTLFQADPAELITQVTEKVAEAGENAPRLLESIGLDGRQLRVIQQLVQSGGLREGVQNAVAGYGSGATRSASQEAFGGLADSTERLGAATQTAAEALGTPFLAPLTRLTDVLAGAASKLSSGLDSKPVQVTLKALGAAVLAAIVGFKLIGGTVNALGLSRLATSGPIRGLGAGLIQGSGNAGAAGFVGRVLGGRGYLEEQSRRGVVPGSERFQGVNARSDLLGQRLGTALAPDSRTVGAFRATAGLGVQGAGILLRAASENNRNARLGAGLAPTPIQSIRERIPNALGGIDRARGGVGDRQDAVAPRSEANKAYAASVAAINAQLKAGTITETQRAVAVGQATKQLAIASGQTGVALRLLGRELLGVATSAVASGASLVGRGAAAVGGALGGPVGIALGGITAALAIRSGKNANTEQRLEVGKTQTNFMDDYAVAVGAATEAVSTFAGAAEAQAKAQIKASRSIEDALKVTDEDIRNKEAFGKKGRLRDYSQGTEESVINRLQGQLQASGSSPDVIQRIQADLLNSGRSRAEVERISRAIPTNANPDADATANIRAQITDIASQPGRGGFRGALARQGLEAQTRGSFGDAPGFNSLSTDQKDRSAELVQGIQERQGRRAAVLKNPQQANAEAMREIDTAVSQAIEVGQFDLAADLQKQYQADIANVSEGRKKKVVSASEIEDAGGSYTRALAERDKTFREEYDVAQATNGTMQQKRERDAGYASTQLRAEINPLAELFDYRNTTGAAGLINKVTGPEGSPEDPAAQSEAIRGVIQETRRMGGSFQDLSANALRAANAIGETGDAAQATITALRAAARQQIRFDDSGRSSGENLRMRNSLAASDAKIVPGTNGTKAEQEAGLEALNTGEDDLLARANARVTQERQIRLQRARSIEDFDRQMLQSRQDFNTQMDRQAESFQINTARTEEQYLIGRNRSLQAFNRQQSIAMRDFAKQMRRQSEDAARAMYDPYQRIQVAGTWDPEMLFGNLDQQNETLARQIRNLQDLRKKGLSEAAITLLQLNDPKQAQQAQALTESTAAQVEGLNRAASARAQLGGKLNSDPANLGVSRSKEDFGQSLRDQNEQMQISLKQGEEDYKRSLKFMVADNARALRIAGEDRDRFVQRSVQAQDIALDRMAEDVKLADQEIVQNLEQAQANLNAVINGQALDLTTGVKKSLGDTSLAIKDFLAGDYAALLRAGGAATGGGEGADAAMEAATTAAAAAPGGSNQATNGAPAGSAAGADAAASGSGFGGVIKGGRVTSEYGQRNGRLHAGIDIGVPIGTPVFAYQDGKVIKAGAASGYGQAVYLDHGDGKVTRYGHLSGFSVRKGDEVRKGQQIASSGNTGRSSGPHLHFETRAGGKAYNPRFAPFAQGGIVTQPTQALIGEAGDREAVIPLNRSGVEVLAQAMKIFMSQEDGKMMRASNGVSYTTYDYSQTMNDNRMVVEHMELKAESPRELAMAMEAQRRRANLTNGGKKR